MNSELVIDIILDALKDSALVFAFVFIFHILLSFIDIKMSNFLIKRKKTAPIFGSLFGIIPQCGTSVMGADLYIKKYITIGTLLSIFVSCSDEALIILLASGKKEVILHSFLLIGIKIVVGIISGYLLDLIIRKQEIEEVNEVVDEDKCSHHHKEKENTKLHKHLIHPLTHSLELFAYVLVINLALGFLIGGIGEDRFAAFMTSSKYLGPLLSSIIGLIPNCSSSVLLSELYIDNSLSFGSLVSGLIINSGLGMMVLIKNKKMIKKTLIILLSSFILANITGYILCFIMGF